VVTLRLTGVSACMQPKQQLMYAGVVITPETVVLTRKHFADNQRECTRAAQSGEMYVNDLDRYVKRTEETISHIESGGWDHTLTFIQRAHWLQTGIDIPLLPRS
jgi:hypothetical protein